MNCGQINDDRLIQPSSRLRLTAILFLAGCSVGIAALWAWVLVEVYLKRSRLSNMGLLFPMAIALLYLIFIRVSKIDIDKVQPTARWQAVIVWIVRACS